MREDQIAHARGVEPQETTDSGVHRIPYLTPEQYLVLHLGRIADQGTLAAACEAGRHIWGYRYAQDGDERPKPGIVRASSFRQLARIEGMPMSPASLCRAVGIYQLALRMPELLGFRRVGVGHVSTVLRLPLEQQVALLYQAEQDGWSRSRLQSRVDSLRYAANPYAETALAG